MDKEILRKAQLTQLEIAKEIKRVCNENGIEYFLEGGSLLGAVRHQGFIPWDDDMDISMTRKNYNKFVKIAPNALNEKYHLESWKTNKKSALPFSKVYKKNTTYLEAYANPNDCDELWVDVFPRDYYPESSDEQKKLRRKTQLIRHILLVKCGNRPWKRPTKKIERVFMFIKYLPFFVVGVFCSKDKLRDSWEYELTKNNKKPTSYMSLASFFSIDKYVIPSNSINELVEMKFEDTEFLCPKDYDSYLRSIYNDYMVMPPRNERKNRHRIIKIKL